VSRDSLSLKGYTVIDDIFSREEIDAIAESIIRANTSKPTFRKTNDLFAIRQFLKEVPEAQPPIFNAKLKAVIAEYIGSNYFVVKSIVCRATIPKHFREYLHHPHSLGRHQ
jgi:hypothetical protein